MKYLGVTSTRWEFNGGREVTIGFNAWFTFIQVGRSKALTLTEPDLKVLIRLLKKALVEQRLKEAKLRKEEDSK